MVPVSTPAWNDVSHTQVYVFRKTRHTALQLRKMWSLEEARGSASLPTGCPHSCLRLFIVHKDREWLTLSRFSGSTSIMPRKRFWQSGGMKWGMWKIPRLTFSNSCRRLSSSKGRAPCRTKDGRSQGKKKSDSLKCSILQWPNPKFHTQTFWCLH